MKYTFFLLSSILLLGCPKPPRPIEIDKLALLGDSLLKGVDSVEITMLQIGLLEGLPPSLPNDGNVSTVIIDSISIPVDSSFEIDKRILKLDFVKKDTVTIGLGSGKISKKSPYQIGMLILNKVTFVKGNDKIVSLDKPINIIKFSIDEYDFQYDASAPMINKLNFKIKDLEARILALMNEIDAKIKIEPDHAAKELSPTLNHLLGKVREIREYYLIKEHNLITESMRTDLQELDNIEYTVEAQEEEVSNPTNAPLVIENELLFATGEFDILQSVSKLDSIIETINKKITECQSEYPGVPIKIALAVTGYADEQEINGDLENILRQKYPNEVVINKGGDKQELLNRLLSQARADNVSTYTKERVLSQAQIVSLSFLKSGAIGKGWQYPIHVTIPCKDDCQQRRVVYISHIVFPQK